MSDNWSKRALATTITSPHGAETLPLTLRWQVQKGLLCFRAESGTREALRGKVKLIAVRARRESADLPSENGRKRKEDHLPRRLSIVSISISISISSLLFSSSLLLSITASHHPQAFISLGFASLIITASLLESYPHYTTTFASVITYNNTMQLSLQILAASTALMPPVTTSLAAIRDSTGGENGDTNVAKVCYPGAEDDGTVPPCVSIANIEQACQPNGTKPIDFEAHAQCMCTGSYFMDWRGCQNCLFVHGFRSARDHVYWEQVVSAASYSLCHASPTAEFQSIFASVQANTKEVRPVTTGESMSSDQFPGKTDVSLYYTATAPAPQGPGVITGAAAMATQVVSRLSASNSTSLIISDSSVGTSPTLTSAGSTYATSTKPAATSSSTAGAPAQGTGVAMAAVAGAALLMAL